MKTALLAIFFAGTLSGSLIAGDLVVCFAEKDGKIVATCDKSTYLLQRGQANHQFLIDMAVVDGQVQQRGHITAVFEANISLDSYFYAKSHLDKLGYSSLKTYILSDDKKTMKPLVVMVTGVGEPFIQKE